MKRSPLDRRLLAGAGFLGASAAVLMASLFWPKAEDIDTRKTAVDPVITLGGSPKVIKERVETRQSIEPIITRISSNEPEEDTEIDEDEIVMEDDKDEYLGPMNFIVPSTLECDRIRMKVRGLWTNLDLNWSRISSVGDLHSSWTIYQMEEYGFATSIYGFTEYEDPEPFSPCWYRDLLNSYDEESNAEDSGWDCDSDTGVLCPCDEGDTALLCDDGDSGWYGDTGAAEEDTGNGPTY